MGTDNRLANRAAGVTITLRGWKAVALLVLLLIVPPIYSRYVFNRAMERLDEAQLGLRMTLLARASRAVLPDLEGLDFSKPENAARVEAAVRETRVQVERMEVRGTLAGRFVFRVEYTVDGQAPKDSDPVEYYGMGYSAVTGWKVHEIRRVHPISWMLAPWRGAVWSNDAGDPIGVS